MRNHLQIYKFILGEGSTGLASYTLVNIIQSSLSEWEEAIVKMADSHGGQMAGYLRFFQARLLCGAARASSYGAHWGQDCAVQWAWKETVHHL